MKNISFVILMLIYSANAYGQNPYVENNLIHTTTKINCEFPTKGSKVSQGSGTGFFFDFNLCDSISFPCLVTNKHVIKKAISCKIKMTLKDSLGNPDYGKNIDIIIDMDSWIQHPDSSIDLVILPFLQILNSADLQGYDLFCKFVKEENIPTAEEINLFTAIEQVYMIGYPKGIIDQTNNVPIVRKGETATPIFLDFQNKSEFLLDIPIYSGSSGSPIYLLDKHGYQKGTDMFSGHIRFSFLGVAYAGSSYDDRGIKIPLNLAAVIKSRELLDYKTVLIEKYKDELNQMNIFCIN